LATTINLHGNDERLVMAVRLMAVVDPDESYDKSEFSFELPESGERYVSIRLRLRNIGELVYDDSPSNGPFSLTVKTSNTMPGSAFTHGSTVGVTAKEWLCSTASSAESSF
jgi:hypothetical protein